VYTLIGDIWFYLFVVGVLISMATYVWQFRKIPGAKPQVYGQTCKAAWLLCLVMLSVSPELSDKVLWIKLQQMVSVLSPYFWLQFILEVSGQSNKMPSRVRYVFLAIIGAIWMGNITNYWHELFWRETWLDGHTIRIVTGQANRIVEINSYLLCALAVFFSVRWVYITTGLRRRQAWWFTISGLVSVGGTILDYVPVVRGFYPLAWGFLLAGVLITWGFYRWHVYNVLSLAQQAAVQNMFDGLLVVDEYGHIADMNPAAKTIFAGLPALVGGKFEELAAAWPTLAMIGNSPGTETREAVLEVSGERRWYWLNVTSLQSRGHLLGKVIVLKDITRQKQDQEKMLEQQKAMSVLTERNRLSRELHDSQGQFPGYVKAHTQAIRLLVQKGRIEDADRQMERLINAANTAFADVRESISGLKTTGEKWDFFHRLRTWLNQFQQTSSILTSYSGPESRPPEWILPEAEVQLLRIIQEALVNARKHSSASRAEVIFSLGDGRLKVTIADNGRGFDEEKQNNPASFGLGIIRERAEEIGGCCKIRSVTDQGTVVTVELPLKQMSGECAI